MKKDFLRITSLFVMLIIFIGCSNEKRETARKQINTKSQDVDALDDRNYIYHNLGNTKNVRFVSRRINGKMDDNVYTDSTYKKHYLKLTEAQKAQLIQKFFSNLMKVDSSYAVNSMMAFFVAKQAKIGNLQPLLIKIGGDDYRSLTIILLDENKKYVSGYNVSGGFMAGPNEKGDTAVTYDTESNSNFHSNKINTYYKYETDRLATVKAPVFIDSVTFESIINADGAIKTRQTGKFHFSIPYSSSIKNKYSL